MSRGFTNRELICVDIFKECHSKSFGWLTTILYLYTTHIGTIKHGLWSGYTCIVNKSVVYYLYLYEKKKKICTYSFIEGYLIVFARGSVIFFLLHLIVASSESSTNLIQNTLNAWILYNILVRLSQFGYIQTNFICYWFESLNKHKSSVGY